MKVVNSKEKDIMKEVIERLARIETDIQWIKKHAQRVNEEIEEGIRQYSTKKKRKPMDFYMYIYVSDTDNCRVVKRLTSNLSYVAEIGSQGGGNDQFWYPQV